MKQTNISLYFFDKKVGRGLAGFKDPAFLENISPPAASVTLVPRRKTKKARFTTHLFQPYMSRLSYQSFVEVIKPFSHFATDDFVFARLQVKVLILHKQFTYRVLPCEHFVIALYVQVFEKYAGKPLAVAGVEFVTFGNVFEFDDGFHSFFCHCDSPPLQYVRHVLAQFLVSPEAEREHDEEFAEEDG